MKMRFVGGFLGSGKTTAIAGACRLLIARGEKVGIVTNDQGKLQVDGLFLRAAGLPAVEVGGGCFCCRYDDFEERLAGLVERERPDTVFAESVGSCADIIATVVKPFEAFRGLFGGSSVFSVLADSRLLLARLSGRRLPFSEDVLYVFDRQLEEADLLVLNKRDLLSEGDRAALRSLAAEAWPGKELLEISASSEEGVAAWLEALSSRGGGARGDEPDERESLDIDYERYGAGERELSWLDERIVVEDKAGLSSDGSRCRAAVLAFVLNFARGLAAAGAAVGHVKLQVSAPGFEAKLSLTAGDYLAETSPGSAPAGLEASIGGQLPPFVARRVLVSLNARAQIGPEELAAIAARAAESARLAAAVDLKEEDRSAFRPGQPRPTHRFA